MARTIRVTAWTENETDTGEGAVSSLALAGSDVADESVERFVGFHRQPNPHRNSRRGTEPEFSGPVWMEVDETPPTNRGWEVGVRWIEVIGDRLVVICDLQAAARWGDMAFELRLETDTKTTRALQRRLQEYFRDWPGFRLTSG